MKRHPEGQKHVLGVRLMEQTPSLEEILTRYLQNLCYGRLPLCGPVHQIPVHQIMPNAIPRQCPPAVQQNELVLSQANGIDNVDALTIASVLACKSQFRFYQFCDGCSQVIRDKHFPSFTQAFLSRFATVCAFAIRRPHKLTSLLGST